MSMLATAAQLAPLAAITDTAPGAGNFLPPVLILLMCVVAGVGTVLLLPSRRETPVRKIGGAVVLAAALVFAALLIRAAAQVKGGSGLSLYFWIFSAIALGGALRVVTHTRPVYSALYFVLTVFATAGLFILLWAEFMAAALVLIYAGAILVTYVFVIMLATSSASPAPDTGAAATEAGPTGNEATNGDALPPPAGARASLAGLAEHDAVSREPLIASAVGFVLMGMLLFVVFDRAGERITPSDREPLTGRVIERSVLAREAAVPNNPAAESAGETQRLGLYLFENHVVNLELAGLLLTVSMVGAIVIARRRIYAPATVGGVRRDDLGAAQDVFHAPMTPIDDDPHSIPVYGTDNPRQKAYPET
jgi:NADH-quinone oxidoreductase subunit J